MNKSKFSRRVLLSFSFVMLTSSLAFAAHDCTRQVVRSDGTTYINVDCSSAYEQTSENFTNRFLFSTLITNLQENLHWGMQDLQAKLSAIFLSQAKAKQSIADLKEREQEAVEAQQIKLQGQEDQLANLKEQQAIQKQQQEAMQDRMYNR
jgi:hypothetical protein